MRLPDGVSLAEVRAALEGLSSELVVDLEFPDEDEAPNRGLDA